MSRYIFIFTFALVVQITFIYAERTTKIKELKTDDAVKGEDTTAIDWFDLFFPPDLSITTPKSVKAKKPTKKHLEEIKEMANLISLIIHDEMEKLITCTVDDKEADKSRAKRSIDNKPLDDSQIILKLLKHIKTNNEQQNKAIERIIDAKEIAEQYGIDFVPDSEIFSELAVASSKQTEDLSLILNDAFSKKKSTKEQVIEFVPVNNESIESNTDNNNYYVYSTNETSEDIGEVVSKDIEEQFSTPPSFEFDPEVLPTEPSVVKMPDTEVILEINIPMETQILAPPMQQPHSFSYMPDFFQQIFIAPDNSQCAPLEESLMTTSFAFPVGEHSEPEPQIVGEVFEETVSSRVIFGKGKEASSAIVNHVTTYTISDKSHFRKPELELPQKMQYYFLLI